MTPSQGSSMGVANAPKTLSLTSGAGVGVTTTCWVCMTTEVTWTCTVSFTVGAVWMMVTGVGVAQPARILAANTSKTNTDRTLLFIFILLIDQNEWIHCSDTFEASDFFEYHLLFDSDLHGFLTNFSS